MLTQNLREPTEQFELNPAPTFPFHSKISIDFQVGRFRVKTVSNSDELMQVLKLRYQIFQIETIGLTHHFDGYDYDQFDVSADHISIFDTRSNQVIATCRLNSSLFTNRFYSEQEFDCGALLNQPGIKLEVGRVCVHQKYRNGATLFMLWRAIADYMKKTNSDILFGCGSVMTEDPTEALAIYQFLQAEGILRYDQPVFPTEKYRFLDFEELMLASDIDFNHQVNREQTKTLIPPLCQLYFEIGCYVPGPPAIDREFKCIDFLTVLNLKEMDARLKKKVFGE